jgi:hypothetical protein
VNKKNSTKKDREILSSVKREMQEPRLAASVRNALEAATVPAAKVLAAHSAKA